MAGNLVLCWVIILITNIKHTIGINNRVRSPIPPLDMSIDNIPMFLTITFDDALHSPAHEKTDLIMNHVNRNNEPIPLVYFISNEFSDYSLVQQRYLQGCEFAIHTVTHTTNVDTDITKWYYEIKVSRELLGTHADIPLTEIVGFRAPYLQKSDKSFQVLNGLQPKFLYDSTVINSLQNNMFDWLYTFDEYEPEMVYSVGQGPKQSYPGFWEVPMYELYKSNGQIYEIMDYQSNYTLILQSFKDNFLHRMNTNKSPMGLYFHSSWLYTQSNVNAMNDFIEWVLGFDDTWIVNNKDVIDWINNPIPNGQYEYINNNKLMNDKTNFISCVFTEGIFKTVQDECPLILPHNLRWNDTELISSDINITSTSDNILTTGTDTCVNDTYTIHDSNTVYCVDAQNKEIVLYEQSLYQCKWWNQGETPGIDASWLLIKECMTYSDSFVKGTIEPYGTVKMFQDNVLDIDININPGYDITRISVTIDNNKYNFYDFNNLSVFEDYNWIRNNQTNSAKLTIRFIEIIHAQYQIEFSFKDVTLAPTKAPTMITTNPSNAPTFSPTIPPSIAPTLNPSNIPTISPSSSPSNVPSQPPSQYPTFSPSVAPSIAPTLNPSNVPTIAPSIAPSNAPTQPSHAPSKYPTMLPSITPTISPTNRTVIPTQSPTQNPTEFWTINPSQNPTQYPIVYSTESVQSMDEMSDKTMSSDVVVSKRVIIGVITAVSAIFIASIGVCMVMYRIIRKQKRKLEMRVLELQDVKSGSVNYNSVVTPTNFSTSVVTPTNFSTEKSRTVSV